MQKPIIASSVGGIPEIINNSINGILVNNNMEEIYQNKDSNFLYRAQHMVLTDGVGLQNSHL